MDGVAQAMPTKAEKPGGSLGDVAGVGVEILRGAVEPILGLAVADLATCWVVQAPNHPRVRCMPSFFAKP